MLKKKITKILIGTNNVGKIKEIRDLLPKNLEIYTTSDFKIKSPIENGKTFVENSLIKARYFSKKSKMICLSDDSGLEIDALEGAPGIYSAEYIPGAPSKASISSPESSDKQIIFDFLEKYLALIKEFSTKVFPFSMGLLILKSDVV